jgi:hypothetical protein
MQEGVGRRFGRGHGFCLGPCLDLMGRVLLHQKAFRYFRSFGMKG